jgi:hypothetical protein
VRSNLNCWCTTWSIMGGRMSHHNQIVLHWSVFQEDNILKFLQSFICVFFHFLPVLGIEFRAQHLLAMPSFFAFLFCFSDRVLHFWLASLRPRSSYLHHLSSWVSVFDNIILLINASAFTIEISWQWPICYHRVWWGILEF